MVFVAGSIQATFISGDCISIDEPSNFPDGNQLLIRILMYRVVSRLHFRSIGFLRGLELILR
jgi:hypothetical protein